MEIESLLKQLAKNLSPDDAQKARVRTRMNMSMRAPGMLTSAINSASPEASAQARIWSQIKSHLAPVEVPRSMFGMRWAAGLLLFVLAIQMVPWMFLAPSTVADSVVIVLPTKGESSMSVEGLWSTIEENTILTKGTQIRTGDGEATVMLHDDGNIRLSSDTAVVLHDLSDRPEPAIDAATMTLFSGKVWVQGLLPDHLRGITIATRLGDVSVRGGSVSITAGDTVTVEVWDRRSEVTHDGQTLSLVAGDRVVLQKDSTPVTVRMSETEEDSVWVTQNRTRDAVHRKEIAQWQVERRAARAGILPTSPLYTVKRVVERVDVMLTLDPQAKIEKQLDLASTRLNEAAALFNEGSSSGGTMALEEYRSTMMAVATGTGGDSVTQFLIRQKVAENSADLSAALPDDDAYALKKAVLEGSAELPDIVDERDVRGTLLVDTIDVLQNAVTNGDKEQVQESLDDLKTYLPSLDQDGSTLRPEIKQEAISLLTTVAATLEEQSGSSATLETDLLDDVVKVIPQPRPTPPLPSLTEEQIQAEVDSALNDVFSYTMPRSRGNELQRHMKRFIGHPDEGRYLRRLYHDLPEASDLRLIVRRAIQNLRDEVDLTEPVVPQVQEGTGSALGQE